MINKKELLDYSENIINNRGHLDIGIPRYYSAINDLYYIRNKEEEIALLDYYKQHEWKCDVKIPESFFTEPGWYSVYIHYKTNIIYVFIMPIDELINKVQNYSKILQSIKEIDVDDKYIFPFCTISKYAIDKICTEIDE